MNTFGHNFRITTFGESHGPAMGVVIDGCPAGLNFDDELLRTNLRRRRPGQSSIVSDRKEDDAFEILSGVFEGKTLGTPITLVVRNQDARSKDYEKMIARPGHADDVWKNKYGISDPRGGGRASGRETVSRVLGGSVAQMVNLALAPDLKVEVWIESIGPIGLTKYEQETPELERLLEGAKVSGESYGGWMVVEVHAAPAGLGQPVFRKLKSDFAQAILSIGAVNSFTLGKEIFDSTKGTDFHGVETVAQYGGIRGGISTGEPINCRISFKPTSSILEVAKKGRHDPCILPRAVPVVESMIHLVLADHLLAGIQTLA